MQNKVPLPPPPEPLNDRKEDIKLEEKKKSQAEIEQEMAALQYTNPQLLEVCMCGNTGINKFASVLSVRDLNFSTKVSSFLQQFHLFGCFHFLQKDI